MAADAHKTLPPPKSDPPPSERAPDTNVRPGWRPADDDKSLEATDWRARTGIRRADRALEILAELKPSFEAVQKELHASNEAWAARWKTLGRVGWAVVLAAVGWGVVKLLVSLSTLHH